jgi:hypothetical protein
MKRFHHLIALLIFTALFLSGFSSHAQSNSDTIRIEKNGLGYIYSQGNVKLNFSQMIQVASSQKDAAKLLEKSKNMKNMSYFFSIVGGGCIGFSLGHLIGTAISNRSVNQTLFFSTLGTGVALLGVGIGFEVGASNKAREGIDVYNKSIKQKNNTNLNLGFSPNGMVVKLNF